MAFSDFILTNAGDALLEKVMSGTTTLKLTSFKIGSGTLTAADIAGLTALKKETASFSFGSVSSLPDDTGVHLTVDVDNKSATSAAYQWTESAIYATDPDSGSIIFAASYATDSGETIPVYDGKYPIVITEDIILAIGSTSTVSITVDGSAWITRSTAQGMIDSSIENKADKATTLAGYGITDAYTKTQADDLLAKKADKATTLSGYNIADAYTKTQTDDLLAKKASASHTHTKSQITDFPIALSAFTNDEGFKKISWTTVTISSSAWNNLTSSVAIAAVTADNAIDVSPAPPQSNIDIWIKAQMYASAQAAGTLTFACKTAPTESVTVNVKCTTAV